MAQLVARLVRNEKVGGSNPPSSTTGRHPIRMSVFCMPGVVLRCLVLCCLRLRWCSGRRRARPPARLGGLTSFGAAPRSPPVPSGPSGALHTSGARCAGVCLVRRLEARPGPATAHGHRSLALWSLRRPSTPAAPAVLCCRCVRPGPAAAHGRRRQAIRRHYGWAVYVCPPYRRNRRRTRIGYCDMDRL